MEKLTKILNIFRKKSKILKEELSLESQLRYLVEANLRSLVSFPHLYRDYPIDWLFLVRGRKWDSMDFMELSSVKISRNEYMGYAMKYSLDVPQNHLDILIAILDTNDPDHPHLRMLKKHESSWFRRVYPRGTSEMVEYLLRNDPSLLAIDPEFEPIV